ncbi:MAG TPA: cytochrome c oxidase subunit II [Rhizomicrobium sp.]
MGGVAAIALVLGGSPEGALSSPMSYLRTLGPRADPATVLLWGMIALSLAVVAIIAVAVAAGIVARRRPGSVDSFADLPAQRGTGGLAWFWVGMPLTVIALVGILVWTVAVLATIDSPKARPRLTLEVTGRQWWWQVRYLSDNPAEIFVTANEIHIPTGEPVLVKLVSADVIHSFWAPVLTGKTDAIPGQINVAWLQADRPGRYHGECAEFCGIEHARMGLDVIAESPATFEAWRRGEMRPAVTPSSALEATGEEVFAVHCAVCHSVRGMGLPVVRRAGEHGIVGPDLTHLMSRETLAAGTVPNTIGGLSGWIGNPQALKLGAQMPKTYLSGSELQAVVRYLETLR